MSRARRRNNQQPDRAVNTYIARIVPMTRTEAAPQDCCAEPASTDVLVQKRFQDETRAKMVEIAKMAIAARRANEADDVERTDMNLRVHTCMMGSAMPTTTQIADMKMKQEKAAERLRNTRARVELCQEQADEIEDEMERLREYILELEELRREEDSEEARDADMGGHGGGRGLPGQQRLPSHGPRPRAAPPGGTPAAGPGAQPPRLDPVAFMM